LCQIFTILKDEFFPRKTDGQRTDYIQHVSLSSILPSAILRLVCIPATQQELYWFDILHPLLDEGCQMQFNPLRVLPALHVSFPFTDIAGSKLGFCVDA